MARPFGQRFSVVTDHRKAVPELEDLVRKYGAEPNCRSVRAVKTMALHQRAQKKDVRTMYQNLNWKRHWARWTALPWRLLRMRMRLMEPHCPLRPLTAPPAIATDSMTPLQLLQQVQSSD